MNTILEIDERNGQVTTEPGVITEVLQDAVREKGLFYPPGPQQPRVLFYRWKYRREQRGAKRR